MTGGVDAAGAKVRFVRHGDQALGSRALQVAPYYLACERAIPVPDVCSRMASRYEQSGRSAIQTLARGGALGAACPSSDGGAHRPGPSSVMEYRQHCCLQRGSYRTHQMPTRDQTILDLSFQSFTKISHKFWPQQPT